MGNRKGMKIGKKANSKRTSVRDLAKKLRQSYHQQKSEAKRIKEKELAAAVIARKAAIRRYKIRHTPTEHILIVGDGNCSFARALVRHFRRMIIVQRSKLTKMHKQKERAARLAAGLPAHEGDSDDEADDIDEDMYDITEEEDLMDELEDIEDDEEEVKDVKVGQKRKRDAKDDGESDDDDDEDENEDEDDEVEGDLEEVNTDEEDEDMYEDDEDEDAFVTIDSMKAHELKPHGKVLEKKKAEERKKAWLERNKDRIKNGQLVKAPLIIDENVRFHPKYDPINEEEVIAMQSNVNYKRSTINLRNCGMRMLVTCYDTEDVAIKKYDDLPAILQELHSAGARVVFGVDCRSMHQTLSQAKLIPKAKFDKVIFNFPHVGSGTHDKELSIRENKQLILDFFSNALPLLRHPGKDPKPQQPFYLRTDHKDLGDYLDTEIIEQDDEFEDIYGKSTDNTDGVDGNGNSPDNSRGNKSTKNPTSERGSTSSDDSNTNSSNTEGDKSNRDKVTMLQLERLTGPAPVKHFDEKALADAIEQKQYELSITRAKVSTCVQLFLLVDYIVLAHLSCSYFVSLHNNPSNLHTNIISYIGI